MNLDELIAIGNNIHEIGDTGWKIEFINTYPPIEYFIVFGDGKYLPNRGRRSVSWQYMVRNMMPSSDFAFDTIEDAYAEFKAFQRDGMPVGGE